MSIGIDELLRYWQNRLPPAREAEVEEALFADASVARRLEAIARLDAGLMSVIDGGKLQAALTVEAVKNLEQGGLRVRTYEVEAGQTVPCTVALEDFVVIRLRGRFGAAERVDVVMDGVFEGAPPESERYEDVPVDRRAGELVFVYPGDRIRALPKSRFRYTVSSGGALLGEFRLDHTPPT